MKLVVELNITETYLDMALLYYNAQDIPYHEFKRAIFLEFLEKLIKDFGTEADTVFGKIYWSQFTLKEIRHVVEIREKFLTEKIVPV